MTSDGVKPLACVDSIWWTLLAWVRILCENFHCNQERIILEKHFFPYMSLFKRIFSWCYRLGNLDFDFRISDFGFPNKTRNPKTDFDAPNPSPRWISINQSKLGFQGFATFAFFLGNGKTVLVSSGLPSANCACAIQNGEPKIIMKSTELAGAPFR